MEFTRHELIGLYAALADSIKAHAQHWSPEYLQEQRTLYKRISDQIWPKCDDCGKIIDKPGYCSECEAKNE
jgi:ribosomal protein L37AE/L43A